MKQGVLPFQYEQEKSSPGMTAMAGMMTYLELMHAAGLRSSVGGPTPSGLAAKLQRLFLTRATRTWRSQRSGQALGGGSGGTRR